MRRRQFLVLAGLSATTSLAGCGGAENTTDTTADRNDRGDITTSSGTVNRRKDTATTETETGNTIADTAAPPTETATSTPLTLETQETGHQITLKKTSHRRRDYSTVWTFPSSTGSHSVVSPGLQGTDYALKFNGFQKGYLSGANAVDRGLRQGDRFAFSFKPTNYVGSPSLIRFQFACSDGSDGDTYRIEFEGSNTAGSDWSLEKYANGSLKKVDAAGDGVGAALGDEYRVVVEWNTGDTHITARWYNPNGTQRSTPLSITDTEFTQPGVCIMCNANVTMLWDEIHTLPS
jgi:hypothetical protein